MEDKEKIRDSLEYNDVWFDTNNEQQRRLYALKFEYLGALYSQYKVSLATIDDIKDAAQHIYTKFIGQ